MTILASRCHHRWTTIVDAVDLVAGTWGEYIADSWVESEDKPGRYQLYLANDRQTAGEIIWLELTLPDGQVLEDSISFASGVDDSSNTGQNASVNQLANVAITYTVPAGDSSFVVPVRIRNSNTSFRSSMTATEPGLLIDYRTGLNSSTALPATVDSFRELIISDGWYGVTMPESSRGDGSPLILRIRGNDFPTQYFLVEFQPDENESNANTIGQFIVTVTVKNQTDSVIPNAPVTIQTAGGDAISGAYARTSTSGVATFNLNAGDYKGIVGAMTNFDSHVAEPFTVVGNRELTLTLTRTPLPESTDLVTCLCHLYVVDQNNDDVNGALVSTQIIGDVNFIGDYLIARTGDTAVTANGTASLELIRGMSYQVQVLHENSRQTFAFEVPDAAAAVMKRIVL